nr:protein YgfX [Thiorhodococcus mannitoliphagus]
MALFVAGSHLVALVAVWALPIGVYRLPLSLLVLVSFVHVLQAQVLRRAPGSIQVAIWQAGGDWQLTLNSGRTLTVRLSASTFVSVPLVMLNFRLGRWRRSALPIPSDAIDPGQLRRLRQRLRLQGVTAGDAVV